MVTYIYGLFWPQLKKGERKGENINANYQDIKLYITNASFIIYRWRTNYPFN